MTTTTTTERSAPRTARLPRRSRRGLIMNLSAAQAITLLVAVLLVAVSIPLFSVGTAFWVGLLVGGPLVAVALVRRDGFPVVEWAPIVWHFWRRRLTRQSGFRVTAATARGGEARAARGGGPVAGVDRTGRVGGGARPVDRRVHLDHAGPGTGVPAAGPGNPGRPGRPGGAGCRPGCASPT